jgi:hypothetical protein
LNFLHRLFFGERMEREMAKQSAVKAAVWFKRVVDFERSGLTRVAWCERHGLVAATLDYWRLRWRERDKRTSLVPVVVSNDLPGRTGVGLDLLSQRTGRGAGVVEIELSGCRLRVDGLVDATWLCAVLGGLR